MLKAAPAASVDGASRNAPLHTLHVGRLLLKLHEFLFGDRTANRLSRAAISEITIRLLQPMQMNFVAAKSGKRPKLTVLTSEGENRCPLIGFVDT